ncbi:hypothetical protein SVAN01_06023 [Stagonosporopsis vannaccii]|nr:hypothetical protein SVAN01_06023 [Stagonosporopsis vannaccii]
MRLEPGFATWRCYHARGCGTASPRLTSSTTLLPSRASYWRSRKGTSHSALLCDLWCICSSICLAAVRFGASLCRAPGPQRSGTLLSVVHYRNMVDVVSDLASSNLVQHGERTSGISIRRTQIRALSVVTLAASSVLSISATQSASVPCAAVVCFSTATTTAPLNALGLARIPRPSQTLLPTEAPR